MTLRAFLTHLDFLRSTEVDFLGISKTIKVATEVENKEIFFVWVLTHPATDDLIEQTGRLCGPAYCYGIDIWSIESSGQHTTLGFHVGSP
jgi:hypothetical protein